MTVERAYLGAIPLPLPAPMARVNVSLAHAMLALAVMTAAGVSTWIAWRPVEYLLSHNVPDDALYYFQTARMISDGGGISVDGEVWANGFHPLWMLMLLPIYLAGAGDETAIHIALTLSGVAVAMSGVLLYACARRLGLREVPSLGATLLYLFHPVVTYMSVNGLETGVNLAVFVGFLYVFICCWQEPSAKHALALSAVAGLLVLSRTDYGITAALGLAIMLLRMRSPLALARLALPASAITAPWFIWNIVLFGSPVQTSAGAVPYVAHQQYPSPDATAWETLRYSIAQVRDGGYDVLPYVYFTPHLDQAHVAFWLLAALLLAAGIVLARRKRVSPLLVLAVPALGLLAQLLVHTGIRWYLREWYLVGVFPLLALVLALLVQVLWSSAAGKAAASVVCAALLAATVVKAADTYRDGWYGLQLDMLAAARWIDAETPEDTRVGAFNSGIVGYFSNRTTVNLDGVMSPDAFEAIRRRRVAAYIGEREITYLAEFPYYPYFFYLPFLGADLNTTELARFDEALTYQGPFVIYRVER